MLLSPHPKRSDRKFLLFNRAAACGLALLSTLTLAHGDSAPAGKAQMTGASIPEVKVTTTHAGGATQFFVENNEYCEVTMTFEMGMVNLTGTNRFPYTATFPPRARTEAFEVEPLRPGDRWEYTYTNYFKLGSNCARHDDNYIYQLPYSPGDKFKVTQGYNGKFSHFGSNQYAIDWDMPEGTLVCAARGGVVVRVKDDSDKGGPSLDYDRFNNYVLIRHDDGTLGHYCHLQKGGVVVKAGQVVAAGDVIAHSGSTGFSSGPHLHFCVFKPKDGRTRVSIPVKFHTSRDPAITLASGHSYRAPEIQNASVHSVANAAL
ncbi:MAG TPA: M23 family metallopeptidase [Verrucomicrobiae bacterium]|nr:M23 family metallopeptidase [Verrucomicrobiae bacterium]